MAGSPLSTWHIISSEYPPQPGGVSDYTAQLAVGLAAAGQPVRVWCHEFGNFTPADLKRAGAELDRFASPGKILLQWVPHGYGYRSLNVNFCRWVASRPEPLEIMVHEPGLGFGEGGIRHNAAAAVHRLMTVILLRKASHVWVSIPAWADRWRPLALGRNIPFTWLPVPGNIPVSTTYVPRTHPFGYFGHYDEHCMGVLHQVLDRLQARVLMMGRGADRVVHPNAAIAGELPSQALSEAIQSCEIMFHIYQDGVSSRRGTVMASLAHEMAIVTNNGRFTEPIWRQSGAVALASDASGLAHQLHRVSANRVYREQLRRDAKVLYSEHFALQNTIRKLMSANR